MKKKIILIIIVILIASVYIWNLKLENEYKKKSIEETAVRNFIEQINKDNEITTNYQKDTISKETFELSKDSLKNSYELCINNYRALDKENTERYNQIIKLFNQYWDLSTNSKISNAQLQAMENILSNLNEINTEIKNELDSINKF
jgi:hypothetical protein